MTQYNQPVLPQSLSINTFNIKLWCQEVGASQYQFSVAASSHEKELIYLCLQIHPGILK
jgi:hypothetical protein